MNHCARSRISWVTKSRVTLLAEFRQLIFVKRRRCGNLGINERRESFRTRASGSSSSSTAVERVARGVRDISPREHVNVASVLVSFRGPRTRAWWPCWWNETSTPGKVDEGSLERVPRLTVPAVGLAEGSLRPRSLVPGSPWWSPLRYVPVADDHALDGLHPGCPMPSVAHTEARKIAKMH